MGREGLYQDQRRATEVLVGEGRAFPVANAWGYVCRGMGKRKRQARRCASLEWLPEHVLYRAMLVLQANLRLLGVGLFGMDGMGMRVQLQQQGVRHHGPAEKQQQKQGDMAGETRQLYRIR